jgi:triosephosphate isomerase
MASASDSKRRKFIGGNWKSNGTIRSVTDLVAELNVLSPPVEIDVVVSPPLLYLPYVSRNLKRLYLLASQDVSPFSSGAYTGFVSAEMLYDFGVSWVILGHSEQRLYNGATNEVIGSKVRIAMKNGLSVIACVGESLQQRRTGNHLDIIAEQLQYIGGNVLDWDRIVIAYEPVWAIVTGLTASPLQAQEVHAFIRSWIEKNVSKAVACKVRILYGGSVKTSNSGILATQPDIDGFLVGGDALVAQNFIDICRSCLTSQSAPAIRSRL